MHAAEDAPYDPFCVLERRHGLTEIVECGVTDMSYLLCASGRAPCNTLYKAAEAFNDDISAWDTSGVTMMDRMFWGALSFNHALGDWNINKVTGMFGMFYGAESFDQDLGWCVGDDVDIYAAFEFTPCERTSCGVAQGQFKTEDGGCESTPAPSLRPVPGRCRPSNHRCPGQRPWRSGTCRSYP